MLQAKSFYQGADFFPYVNLCVDAEEAVKTGKLADRLAVELSDCEFIIENRKGKAMDRWTP